MNWRSCRREKNKLINDTKFLLYLRNAKDLKETEHSNYNLRSFQILRLIISKIFSLLGSGYLVDYAAAAKSRQSCLTLCDLIDGSPPGSHIPGILQARTLEWVAISFSNVSEL